MYLLSTYYTSLVTSVYTSEKEHQCSKISDTTSTFLPAATKLGQGNVFTGVCDSVHRGVCLSTCWDTTLPPEQTPLEQTPPRADTHHPKQTHHPLEQTPPWSRHTPPGADTLPPAGSRLWHTVNEWPVRILLECILVMNQIACVNPNIYPIRRRPSLSVCVYIMSILSLVSHGFNCQKMVRMKYFVEEMTFFNTADLFLTCFYPP